MRYGYIIGLMLIIAMVALSGCLGGDDEGSETDDDESNDFDNMGGDQGAICDYDIWKVVITPEQNDWSQYEKDGKYYEDANETVHLMKGVKYWVQCACGVTADVEHDAFKIYIYLDGKYLGNATKDFDNEDNTTRFYWTVDAEPGSHVIKAVVDPYKQIKDKDRSNNEESFEFIVDPAK